MAEQTSRLMGRPPLNQEDKSTILGALLLLEKGTPAYRKKRRELATSFDRTERGIDTIFEQLKVKVKDKVALASEHGQSNPDQTVDGAA